MELELSLEDDIQLAEVIELYKENGWTSAEKPEKLIPALKNSDALVTARISGKLVGIGNAISVGSLVVYYPHMLVHQQPTGPLEICCTKLLSNVLISMAVLSIQL